MRVLCSQQKSKKIPQNMWCILNFVWKCRFKDKQSVKISPSFSLNNIKAAPDASNQFPKCGEVIQSSKEIKWCFLSVVKEPNSQKLAVWPVSALRTFLMLSVYICFDVGKKKQTYKSFLSAYLCTSQRDVWSFPTVIHVKRSKIIMHVNKLTNITNIYLNKMPQMLHSRAKPYTLI